MEVICTTTDTTPIGILGLPIELLKMIFDYLARSDWKSLRLARTVFSPIVADLCLQNMLFTLSENGVKGLVKAYHDGNSKSIRTLTHVPIPAWPECSIYDKFCERFYDSERDGPYADGIPEDDIEALDAHEQGLMQKDIEHERLFDVYQEEYEWAQTQIRSLASDLYFLKENQREQSPLQQFDDAIKSFKNLQDFVQEAWSQDFDSWWRHLYLEEYSGADEDAEALHLLLILRAIALARLRSLRRMKFSVRGPAFWTANRFGWLLHDGDHKKLRERQGRSGVSIMGIESDIAAEEEEDDDSNIVAQEREKFAKELDTTLNSVQYVRYLDLTVSDDDLPDRLLSIAAPLSEFLGRARELKRLSLSFGVLTGGYPRPENHCTDGTVKLLTLLTDSRLWPNLQRLKLAIVIEEQTLLDFLSSIREKLTRLTLTRVTLPPGKGTWESALKKIDKMLPGVHIKLHFLYDYPLSGSSDDEPTLQSLYAKSTVRQSGDVSCSQYI